MSCRDHQKQFQYPAEWRAGGMNNTAVVSHCVSLSSLPFLSRALWLPGPGPPCVCLSLSQAL